MNMSKHTPEEKPFEDESYRLAISQGLYTRYLDDLQAENDDPTKVGVARTRLIAGIQVALRDACERGFDSK